VLVPLDRFPRFHQGVWPFFDLLIRAFGELMKISLSIAAPAMLPAALTRKNWALLRRPRASTLQGLGAGAQGKPVSVHGVEVDPARRQARLSGTEIELTAHEFDLLYLLASNPGIVFSREALVQRVWGGDTHVTDRSVDTLVKRVRRKIEDDRAEPRFILTVWGTGYKFADV